MSEQGMGVVGGEALYGEVVTWSCTGMKWPHRVVVAALAECGLDTGVARELHFRHAFSRACRKLAESRIIKALAEDSSSLTFQFTKESKDEALAQYAYSLETLVVLDKATGKVSCPVPALADQAQRLLDEAVEMRTGSDITRIVQRLFNRHADLFPIRDRGGVYFVPVAFRDFAGRVDAFLQKLGSKLDRWPVPTGYKESERSVKDSVALGMERVIEEHEQAIAAFDDSTRADTFERREELLRATGFKLEAYADWLGEQKERLQEALRAAQVKLLAAMTGIAADTPALDTPAADTPPGEAGVPTDGADEDWDGWDYDWHFGGPNGDGRAPAREDEPAAAAEPQKDGEESPQPAASQTVDPFAWAS